MKKGAIIALLALATSTAVFAGSTVKKSKHKVKAKTECCVKSNYCPPSCCDKKKCN